MVRITPCIECGVSTPYKTTNRVCCESCVATRTKRRYRRAAERRRRMRGAELVKGTAIGCDRCGQLFVRLGCTAKYCQTCRPRAALERRYRLWAERPALAINSRMSNAIGLSLRGMKRGRGWESLVGYTLGELARHLEKQFPPGMCWENRTLWHIDHIVPLSAFTFRSAEDVEFIAAWALSNLRPLWSRDNKVKYAKRFHLI